MYAQPRVTLLLEAGMQVRLRLRVLSRDKVRCRSDAAMRDAGGRGCVNYTSHFDSAVAKSFPPLGSAQLCSDLPGDASGLPWSDGERLCSNFEHYPSWCQTLGRRNDLGEGSAVDKCCACGGGARTGRGPFVGVTPGPLTLAQRILDDALPADAALLAHLESCQTSLNTSGPEATGTAVHERCCECGGGTREHPVADVEVTLAHVNQVASAP